MKMTKEKWQQFGAFALIYGVLFTIVCLILDGVFTELESWQYYLFQGVIFGLLMAAMETFWLRKKK